MPYIPHTPFKFSRDDVLLTTITTTTQKPVYKDMKCPILGHPAHEYSARHAEHKHYENWILFCCLFFCFRLSPPFFSRFVFSGSGWFYIYFQSINLYMCFPLRRWNGWYLCCLHALSFSSSSFFFRVNLLLRWHCECGWWIRGYLRQGEYPQKHLVYWCFCDVKCGYRFASCKLQPLPLV